MKNIWLEVAVVVAVGLIGLFSGIGITYDEAYTDGYDIGASDGFNEARHFIGIDEVTYAIQEHPETGEWEAIGMWCVQIEEPGNALRTWYCEEYANGTGEIILPLRIGGIYFDKTLVMCDLNGENCMSIAKEYVPDNTMVLSETGIWIKG